VNNENEYCMIKAEMGTLFGRGPADEWNISKRRIIEKSLDSFKKQAYNVFIHSRSP